MTERFSRLRRFAGLFVGVFVAMLLVSPGAAGQVETVVYEGPTSDCLGGGCGSTCCPSCATAVLCNAGETVVSGGFRGEEAMIESIYPPTSNAWAAARRGDFTFFSCSSVGHPLAQGAEYGICAPQAQIDGYTRVQGPRATCALSTHCTTTVPCPAGLVAIGGGARGEEAKLQSSYPLSSTVWQIEWYRAQYEYASAAIGAETPYVVCATEPEGYQIVTGTEDSCGSPNERCTASVSCPEGKVAIGGGAKAFPAKLQSSYPNSPTSWEVTYVRAVAEYGGSTLSQMTPYVVCATGTGSTGIPASPDIFEDGFESGDTSAWTGM